MTYVIDANVLIDYLECAPVVITTVARTLGPVHVPRAVYDEVCDEARFPDRVAVLRQLSLCIHDESTEQLLEAGLLAESHGRLSFQDALCLVVARDLRFSCITNDKPLRSKCGAIGVEVVWGLNSCWN